MPSKNKTKKTLILFSSFFETGGIQRYNQHFCDALSLKFPETRFTAILLDPVGIRAKSNWANIRVRFILNIPGKFLKKVFFSLHVIVEALRRRPNFVICGHLGLVSVALCLKKILRVPYGVVAHGTDVWATRSGLKYKGLKQADLIIAVSRYTRGRMVTSGISQNKIKIVPNTIDTSLFRPKPVNKKLFERFQLEGKRVLLTTGRISSQERYKGHDVLLGVMGKLDEKFIWIVVGGGDDCARLMKKSEEYGFAQRAHFVGNVDTQELIDYYNLCDVFVLPSTGEGFGIVFLEAMACGKPVIGGNADGSRDPMMDGDLGYLVDPRNVDEIVESVKSACLRKETRNDPVFLRSQVQKHFGAEAFRLKIEDIFKSYV